MIQIADFAGSLGISLLIAIVNAMVVDLLTLPLLRVDRSRERGCTGARTSGSAWSRSPGYDALLRSLPGLDRRSSATGPSSRFLQSNIEQRHKNKGDPAKIIAEFAELVERAVARPRAARPDRLAGDLLSVRLHRRSTRPSIADGSGKPGPLDHDQDHRSRTGSRSRTTIADDLHPWTDQARVPMLVGSIFYDHQPGRAREVQLGDPLRARSLERSTSITRCTWFPFGEYFPLIETLPWLARLTPYHGEKLPSLSFGREPLIAAAGPLSPGGHASASRTPSPR